MRSTRKTRQTTKKTWYEPMAASSQAGTELVYSALFKVSSAKRQDQIYRRSKNKQFKKKRRLKGKLVTGCRGLVMAL